MRKPYGLFTHYNFLNMASNRSLYPIVFRVTPLKKINGYQRIKRRFQSDALSARFAPFAFESMFVQLLNEENFTKKYDLPLVKLNGNTAHLGLLSVQAPAGVTVSFDNESEESGKPEITVVYDGTSLQQGDTYTLSFSLSDGEEIIDYTFLVQTKNVE